MFSIPLVPRQPVHPIADRKSTKPSARESKEKVSSRKPRDEQNNESPMPAPLPDERYVSDGYNFAVNAISTMVGPFLLSTSQTGFSRSRCLFCEDVFPFHC